MKLKKLTDSEMSIVELLADGGNAKTISRDLGISNGRVRNSLGLIYRKTGLSEIEGSKSGHLIKMYNDRCTVT